MLDTLLKIGEWRGEKLSKWDRILDKPNVKWESRGKSVTNYVIGLVFDLDEKNVYPDLDLLKEYDEEVDPEQLKSIQIQGGNNKSIYATVEPKKLKQIFKTFFGKLKNEEAKYGELIEVIYKDFPQYQDSKLFKLVKALFPLRKIFIEKSTKDGKVRFKSILDSVELGTYENIALVYAAVKSEEYGFVKPYPIAQLGVYERFLESKFLEPDIDTPEKQDKLCYASGDIKEDVVELDLSTRYSLNKMFVTETKNYASLFDKNAFPSNYQVSLESQGSLDLASEFLLSNYKIRIADVDHVIIPQFVHHQRPDFDLMLDSLKTKSDLLFSFQELEDVTKDIELEVDEVYWLNFLAFESDGNFFKTLEIIKDISKFHFQNVVETFQKIDWEFRALSDIVDWESAKKNYGKVSRFNLNTVYGLIPIRKDKEKKNVALQLFKSILEQRKIEKEQLFQFFSQLMLCHYYARYSSYTNVHDYSQNGNRTRQDYFIWAVRDSIFKYLAFIQVLRKLNLIDMEKNESNEDQKIDFGDLIYTFFTRMDYNDDQKALFYLGRMLNDVLRLQKEKNKTVLEKLNYNGMDKNDLQRLSTDLFAKKLQYNNSDNKAALKSFDFNHGYFKQLFDYNHWQEKNITEQEALFFILTGYSFGIVKQQDSNPKSD